MKAPQDGLRERTFTNTNRAYALVRRSSNGFAAPFASLATVSVPILRRYIGPSLVLALLITACFTLPLHRWARSGANDSLSGSASGSDSRAAQPVDLPFSVDMPSSSTRSGPHAFHFRIPLVRRNGGAYALAFWFAVNALLLTFAALYWFRCLRNRDADPKYKRYLLRLIFTIPAFAGVMAASVIAGSDLGGRVVAATLGTAGVISSALLIATVIGRSASTIAVVIMAAVMGLMNIFPAWATVAAALGSIAGLYPARRVRDRKAVVRCAAVVMSAAAVSAFVAALVTGRDPGSAGSVAMQALLTGCLGAAIWFTLLTMLERPCELTTPLGLLELLDPTSPILEQFSREAPGTFAHSLMVGHLAASAAEAISADPLLCRVAAQYHDIGKLCRAQFFRENQQGGENVHDRLAPSLSAIIVNSHVRDGERMAKELGLPPVIQDIIMQHHGTTLMRYFYYRASAGVAPVDNDPLQYQFRYPGPKPQTKEAAIMMVADAVEAASRTLVQPTKDSVRALVDSVVDDRIDDHQLDECPLTLKDITIIRVTLTEVVCAMLHQRIEYPGAFRLEEKAEAATGDEIVFDFYENYNPAILLPRSQESAEPDVSVEADSLQNRPSARGVAPGGDRA